MWITLLTNWRVWGVLALGLAVLATYVQTKRLGAVKAEYAAFQANVKAVGEVQERETKKQDAANKQSKEKADVENAKTRRDLAGLYAAYGKLRDQRASGGYLPEAPAGSPSPATATLDRAGFNRALSGFDAGVTGLLREGDSAIIDLNSAKTWAQDRR